MNLGIAPPASDTLLGQTRGLIGDTEYVALVPPLAGFGEYVHFGDVEILAFLTSGRNSPLRATGHAFLQFAAIEASAEAAIRTDDLGVNTASRSKSLREIAGSWFARADAEDAATESTTAHFALVEPARPAYAAGYFM